MRGSSARSASPDDDSGRIAASGPAQRRESDLGVREAPRPDCLRASRRRLPDAADRRRDHVLVQPPDGALQLRLERVHVQQLAELERRAGHPGRDRHVTRGRAARDDRRHRARDAHGDGHRAPSLRRARRDERPRVPADVDARDRPRCLAADAVPEHDRGVPARFHRDLHRARDVHRELRRRHREGAADRLRPAPRGGGDGPRRERGDDVPQGDVASHRPGDARCGVARVRALHRRLRHHLFQCGRDADVPDLRVGHRPRRGSAAGERHRECNLHRGDRNRPHERLLGVPKRETNTRSHMTTTAPIPLDLQQAAKEHLWMHFTRMGGYGDTEVPIIVRGDGCHLEDSNGRRYIDALAGLFSVNIGYSFGDEIGQAAHEQMRELPFYTNWSYAHPRAIELAAEVAELAPGDLNRVFFVSGGSEAVESAWKLARQYHTARGERRWKAIARRVAYHGTTMGALSINGCTELRAPFEPLVPDVLHVSNTNRYHRPADESEERFTSLLLDELEATIRQAGPEPVALV